MSVVLAHGEEADIQELRRALSGAGLDSALSDCVSCRELPVRVAQRDVEMVVIRAGGLSEDDWRSVREAMSLTQAPGVAVGKTGDESAAEQARSCGVAHFIAEENVRDQLDELVNQLVSQGAVRHDRGVTVSVFAPAWGSGGTTVALNLAGALAGAHPGEVALVELSRDGGDVALLLGAKPRHTVAQVCERWQRLDVTGLAGSVHDHESGLKLLVNTHQQTGNPHLHVESARRLGILARLAFKYTVFELESDLHEEEFEVMRLSDSVVMVVRADVPGMLKAQYALEQAVSRGVPKERMRLVVNRWGQGGQISAAQIERSLGMSVGVWIPDDPGRVNRASNQGSLLKSAAGGWSKICRRFDQLAELLNGAKGE